MGYRGEIIGKFRATTDVVPSVYKIGERFAQLLILPVPDVHFEAVTELSESDRGEGCYGSTGDISAASGSQSLPESEGEPTNSETVTEPAAGENTPEQE